MSFVQAMQTKDTVTQNGALSNSSTGNPVLDYFAKAGSYRDRPQMQVDLDMASIFSYDPILALKVVFYNRMVTRTSNGFESLQKGQGNKDEFVKSLKWIENSQYAPLLYKNLHLLPVVGCWKDLWYDSPVSGVYNYVNTEYVYDLIGQVINSEDKVAINLLAKFLPKIRSSSNTKSDRHRRLNSWAKGLCKKFGWSEQQYRKFKSDPSRTAHNFQRLMCKNNWELLNFNQIPGKALMNLVKGKSITNHDLEDKFTTWIEKQPTAKFTGYVYELYKAALGAGNSKYKQHTYNAQFNGLIEQAKKDVPKNILEGGVLCALDTSGSMQCTIGSGDLTAYDICVSLGVFFSELIEGDFHENVIMFDNKSTMMKLNGTFCDKVKQIISTSTAWGSTNFQSVIDEIVRVRKQNPSLPVESFPKYLLVVSDMQFNPTGGNTQTNYEIATQKLKAVGLPPMSYIWWNVNGMYGDDFPSTINDNGTTLISGFDPSVVTLLLGGEEKEIIVDGEVVKVKENPLEKMMRVLGQEVLNEIRG